MSATQTRLFHARNHRIELGQRTLVMGIVNVTPDSFSDGGDVFSTEAAVARAIQQLDSGAAIVDIGGESTRPGSDPLPLNEEFDRVIPVIGRLVTQKPDAVVSIDTYKSEVAEAALEAGASIVNDISGGSFDPRMSEVVAKYSAGVILMHIKGTPRDMQKDPCYDDVVREVCDFLQAASDQFTAAEVPREAILVDPGIGFGKLLEHNLLLSRNLASLATIAQGVVYGPSRKSFIGLITGRPVGERLAGTLGSVVAATHYGADIVRVHDVAQAVDALKIADAINGRFSPV